MYFPMTQKISVWNLELFLNKTNSPASGFSNKFLVDFVKLGKTSFNVKGMITNKGSAVPNIMCEPKVFIPATTNLIKPCL